MSAETANAARYDKGLMKLSPLEEDLLEVLEEMVLVAEGGGNLIIDPWAAVEKAKAALAKAYGEE
jgi:hypothetical protein